MTERELRALAAYVDLPEERDLAPAVRARLRGRPARRGWIVVAFAAALVAVAAAFAVPPARSAILRFFHLQGATIVVVDELPALHPPRTLDLGIRIDPADAARTAGFRPLESSLLGRPDEVTWDGGLLWYRYGHVRLLVSQGVGRERSDLAKKVYEPGTTLHGVEVDGEQGYFLSGARHLVYLAPNNLYREERVRLAEDVLLWQHGPLLMRIEGRFTEAEALRIARSFRASKRT
jgi:hypothetical protein